MNIILKVGLDVHSTNYTVCIRNCLFMKDDVIISNTTVEPTVDNIIRLIDKAKLNLGLTNTFDIECGYEAGCLGYSLYHQLTRRGLKCVILAPTTMHKPASQSVQKTDKRDAILISECLSNGTYKSVYVLTKEDNEIKEYLRMRDDRVDELVRCKQQINAFVLRQGKSYSGTKWTDGYKKWLNELQLSPVLKETLDEYLLEFNRINESIERINKRIDEFTQLEKYNGDIKKMSCLLGIERRTALRIITEIGDFKRFPSAAAFARFLGITPGEHSSGESNCKLPITKTGNSQLRSVLIESAQGICKGKIGYKSRRLKVRQEGNSPEIIQYADHANIRMRSKFYKMTRKGKKRNVAVVAVARELSCFIWGMMTGHTKIA